MNTQDNIVAEDNTNDEKATDSKKSPITADSEQVPRSDDEKAPGTVHL